MQTTILLSILLLFSTEVLSESGQFVSEQPVCCSSPPVPWEVCGLVPVSNQFAPQPCSQDVLRSGISCAVRQYVMNMTLQMTLNAGQSPCPFNTFGATIVRHHGPNIADIEVICTGINSVGTLGETAHGEIEALRNCSQVIAARYGPGQVTNLTLWHQFSLYTTGESCPMCMSAIRFSTLGEAIYATSIETLHTNNWSQISIFSAQVQAASNTCSFGSDGTAMQTRIVSGVLVPFMDQYFQWQFTNNPCPTGCTRGPSGCAATKK